MCSSVTKLGMHSERGAVVVIFSIFMLAIIPLLALSVDTYFMAQGRMDEQNIAEYASLTTLDGYIVGSEAEVNIENAHAAGQTKSLLYLKSIEGDNKVTGLAANSGWNLTQNSCNGTVCAGTGWTLEYGTLDLLTGIFTQASDPGLINAVRFSMELPDNSFYSYLRTQVNKESGSSQQDNMKLPVSAIGYMEVDGVGDKYFRLYRNRASGVDGEDGPDGDDGPVVDSGNHTGGGAI